MKWLIVILAVALMLLLLAGVTVGMLEPWPALLMLVVITAAAGAGTWDREQRR